jgi:NAD-dependent deacetylase
MKPAAETPGGQSLVDEVGRVLVRARTVAVMTGAGVSAESGVPTFRGPDGLWRNFRAEDLATPEAFARDAALVWEWYRWRRRLMTAVAPNPGHLALALMEPRFQRFTLITQNVDGLHARAGSRRLVELHGNIWRDRCSRDPAHRFLRSPSETAGSTDAIPLPRCHCGALLRPDVVWFGEGLNPSHLDAAIDAVSRADVFLVVGTSSVVYPAAALPGLARRTGACVVEINPEDTPLSPEMTLVLRGRAGVLLPELERICRPASPAPARP